MKVFRVGYALDKLTQPNPNLGSSDHVVPAVSGTHLRSLEAPLIKQNWIWVMKSYTSEKEREEFYKINTTIMEWFPLRRELESALHSSDRFWNNL